jgi:hypothetical protein
VSDLQFAQPARRNLLVPVLLAFLILGIVLALFLRLIPNHTADLAITHTAVYPAHTVFKSESMVVANQRAEDNLYVLATLRIDDRLHVPLFLKDFTATLTTAEGEEVTSSAVEQHDLDAVYTSFPEVKALATTPLLRETMINPGNSAEGMVLLRFPVTQDVWDRRRSATLNIELYHQGQQSILIPNASNTTSNPTRSANQSPTH